MNRYVSLFAALVLFVLSMPAHAVSNPDATVNAVNSSFRPSATPAATSTGGIGGTGGGTGGSGIGEICNSSPENATVLLALLSGAGLLAGRRMRRVRFAPVAIS